MYSVMVVPLENYKSVLIKDRHEESGLRNKVQAQILRKVIHIQLFIETCRIHLVIHKNL